MILPGTGSAGPTLAADDATRYEEAGAEAGAGFADWALTCRAAAPLRQRWSGARRSQNLATNWKTSPKLGSRLQVRGHVRVFDVIYAFHVPLFHHNFPLSPGPGGAVWSVRWAEGLG